MMIANIMNLHPLPPPSTHPKRWSKPPTLLLGLNWTPPHSKLDYYISPAQEMTLKDIQSLIGLLNLSCSVVVPGRAFLRRLIDLTHGIRLPHHLIKLSRAEAFRRELLQFPTKSLCSKRRIYLYRLGSE